MSLADDEAAERARLHERLHLPLAFCVFGYVVAYAVLLMKVETVMGSGPILAALGIWLAVRGHQARHAPSQLLGAGLAVLLVTLFITVNALSWSPSDAEDPFAVIGAVLGVVVVGLALLSLRAPRRAAAVELRDALGHTPR